MKNFATLAFLFAALLLVPDDRLARAQPLIREANPEIDEPDDSDPDMLRRRALARQRAELEEEQRLKQQAELMRLQGERMLAEREEIARGQKRMRYAGMIAILVIAVTLLIAYARSRVADGPGHGGAPRGP